MKILVTGGAGFIGSHLVARLLAEGMRVAVLDDLSAGSRASLGEAQRRGLRADDVFVADVASSAGAAVVDRWRPEVVVHLAAQSKVSVSVRAPQCDALVNVVGTVNLLDAAVRAGVRRVVAASSGGTVYGEMPSGLRRIPEATSRRPVCPYGVGKAAADSYLHVFQELYGLPTTTLLLGNVYGPRHDHATGDDVISSFVEAVAYGRRPVVCGDGAQTRDFVHVTDVVDAFVRACRGGVNGAVNIGSGVETSVGDVARLVCAALAACGEVDYAPARPGEVRRVCLDNSRARALLGWRARTGLQAGIGHLAERVPRSGPAATVGAQRPSGCGARRDLGEICGTDNARVLA